MDSAEGILSHCQPTSTIMAAISLILNIFFPGFGTILNGVVGPALDIVQIIIGVIQIFTAVCVIGWVWSIVWGIIIFMRRKQSIAGQMK